MNAVKKRYSGWSVLREGLRGQTGWTKAWHDRDPEPHYDVIIIGGGGHGLATAYYLARTHGIARVAVIEKGWIGGGNTGRNTTIIRSNYFYPESAALYDLSVSLYEGLSRELNYNIMFSQRGMIEVAHSEAELEMMCRAANAMRINGIDIEILSRDEVLRLAPLLARDLNVRWPVLGGQIQRRAGVARHDAVAWGYARGADARGVDIIQNCEVTGFDIEGGKVVGLQTTRGAIRAKKVGVVVAGHCGVLAGMAGFRLPIESHPLQAMVSEPIKPVLDCVVMSGQVHVYVSQSDKGELVFGAGIDSFNSYSQVGSPPVVENMLNALIELFPIFSRLRFLRQWGGIVDTCPDASPIIGKTPVENLFFNCGWGTGGFKATPGSGHVFAHTIATGEPHKLAVPFALERFTTGYLIDEHGAAGVAH
jgi:sarcosine oxidase subunit beta